jgi:pimeloyl-ACP methyl ester carboxylesterase
MLTAYLHGFGSGPGSRKGRALAAAFEAAGRPFERLDMNRPSFSELTISDALAALDDWSSKHPEAPFALVGSSLGGYLAALWAERHPERVTALVLLCPGLDMTRRWPILFGAAAMARWRAEGRLALPDARGVPTPIHWGFIEDALRHEPVPHPSCPTLVIHGTCDAVVPVEGSRAWVRTLPNARLVEVDDDHELIASLPLIASETLAFLPAA